MKAYEQKMTLTSTQEDYLEAVLELTSVRQVARNKELADKLGVKRATVSRAVKNLVEKGLIEHENHSYITLTEKGKKIAVEIFDRHRLFTHFFRDILELEEKESQNIACEVEHLISGKALKKFRCLIEKIDSCKHNCINLKS
jgi:DtxR family Mn-dependent transcriptional regulator